MKQIVLTLASTFALLVMLSGCAGLQTPPPTAAVDLGPVPTNIEPAVKQYFDNALVDPFSAHYEVISQPYRAYLRAPMIQGGGISWQGWTVDVRVNAKNRMGGYTGWTGYHVLFVGNVAINAIVTEGYDVLFHRID